MSKPTEFQSAVVMSAIDEAIATVNALVDEGELSFETDFDYHEMVREVAECIAKARLDGPVKH